MTNREMDDPRNREPLDLSIREEEDEAERKSEHRDPWYFDYWPSDEQLEYFKRGNR